MVKFMRCECRDDDNCSPVKTGLSNCVAPIVQRAGTKRLKFAEVLATAMEVPSRHDYSMEEKSEIWYSGNEYADFRRETKMKAAVLREHRDSFLLGIDECYDVAEELAAHIREENELSTTLRKINLSRTGMAAWCIQDDFRGLEKYVSSGIRGRRELLRAGVYRVAFDSKILIPSHTRKQYQDLSRATRVFARMVGHADFLAALALQNES